MDIRQNPINPNVLPATPQQRPEPPPTAGPAAVTPVAPALPAPLPSVVAISENARTLALRSGDVAATGEQDEADMAAVQLELMLGMIRVYTPPPPPTPQELGEQIRAAAQQRQAQAEPAPVTLAAGEPDSAAAAAPVVKAEPDGAAVEAAGRADPALAPAAGSDESTDSKPSADAAPERAEPTLAAVDARLSRRFVESGDDDSAPSQVSLRV